MTCSFRWLATEALTTAAPGFGPEPVAEETLGYHRSYRCGDKTEVSSVLLVRASQLARFGPKPEPHKPFASQGGRCPSRSSSSCCGRSRSVRRDRNPGGCHPDRSPSDLCRRGRNLSNVPLGPKPVWRCFDGAEAPSKGNVAAPTGSTSASTAVPISRCRSGPVSRSFPSEMCSSMGGAPRGPTNYDHARSAVNSESWFVFARYGKFSRRAFVVRTSVLRTLFPYSVLRIGTTNLAVRTALYGLRTTPLWFMSQRRRIVGER